MISTIVTFVNNHHDLFFSSCTGVGVLVLLLVVNEGMKTQKDDAAMPEDEFNTYN